MRMISLTKQEELRKFWPSRQPLTVLAQEWGCSPANISQIARRLGLPARAEAYSTRCIAVSARYPLSEYMQDEADKRGIDVNVLYYRVLRTVIRDRLVGAILDDEVKKAA